MATAGALYYNIAANQMGLYVPKCTIPFSGSCFPAQQALHAQQSNGPIGQKGQTPYDPEKT